MEVNLLYTVHRQILLWKSQVWRAPERGRETSLMIAVVHRKRGRDQKGNVIKTRIISFMYPPRSSSLLSMSGAATSSTSDDTDSRQLRTNNRKDKSKMKSSQSYLRTSNSGAMRITPQGLSSRKESLGGTQESNDNLFDEKNEIFPVAEGGESGGERERACTDNTRKKRNGNSHENILGNSDEGAFLFDYDEDKDSLDDVGSPSYETLVSNPSRVCESSSEGDEFSWAHVLPRAPACPHFSVTGSDGLQVFLKIRAAESVNGRERCVTRFHSKLQLLTRPFAELKATVEEEVKQHNYQHYNHEYQFKKTIGCTPVFSNFCLAL